MIDNLNTNNSEDKKEKSIFLHLTDIIGNDPHWLFPLNKERFDKLLNSDFSKEEVNDFKAIFLGYHSKNEGKWSTIFFSWWLLWKAIYLLV